MMIPEDIDKRITIKKKKTKKHKEIENDEQERELLLAGTRSKREKDNLTPEQRKVYDKTRRAIAIFSKCICIHALLVEGPLCILEGIIRSAIFFALGLIMLLISFFALKWLKPYSILFLNESLITLSAVITITILPGSVMLVYRWYHDDDDWDLAPIPTIMGWVDARRFITFTNGNGLFAKNVKVKDKSKSKRKKNKDSNNEIYSTLLAIDQKCQDSFSKVIIFAPRVVSSVFFKISKGENVDLPFLDNDDEDEDEIDNENDDHDEIKNNNNDHNDDNKFNDNDNNI